MNFLVFSPSFFFCCFFALQHQQRWIPSWRNEGGGEGGGSCFATIFPAPVKCRAHRTERVQFWPEVNVFFCVLCFWMEILKLVILWFKKNVFSFILNMKTYKNWQYLFDKKIFFKTHRAPRSGSNHFTVRHSEKPMFLVFFPPNDDHLYHPKPLLSREWL